ncbi:MAG: hypothetical protein AAB552_00005 [Patescibacteria group bacterium]
MRWFFELLNCKRLVDELEKFYLAGSVNIFSVIVWAIAVVARWQRILKFSMSPTDDVFYNCTSAVMTEVSMERRKLLHAFMNFMLKHFAVFIA